MKTYCPYPVLAGALLACSSFFASAQPYAISSLAGSARQTGSTDGTNSAARFKAPAGVALDPAGNLYVADPNAIRKVSPQGTNWVVTTLAGQSNLHGTSDGTNTDALFNYPQGIAVDSAGKLFVADSYNNGIRVMAAQGTNWVVSTVVGLLDPFQPGFVDGTNGVARFNQPYGIAVDGVGNLYVADTGNHAIRKVAPSGTNWVVTTLAGSLTNSGGGDGTNENAQFASPVGIAVDSNGQVYVADSGTSSIRKLTPLGTNWVVTTLAGLAGNAGSADGLGSAARFKRPWGVALDSVHNLFVTDSGNNTLRKVTPAGQVSTLAGLAGNGGSSDGIGSVARFNAPTGVAVSGSGLVCIAESSNADIRQGQVAPWLQIGLVGNQVAVAWPVALTGYVLQASSGLAGAGWTNVTSGLVISGDYLVRSNAAVGGGFYRLWRP